MSDHLLQSLAVAAASSLITSAVAGASTLVLAEQSFPARGLTREFQIVLQPPMVKKEVWSGKKLESTIILDRNEKISRVLDNQARTYTEIAFGGKSSAPAPAHANAPAPAASAPPAPPLVIKEIPSKSETGKWPCKAVEMLSDGKKIAEACVAEGKQLGFGAEEMKLLSVSQLLMPIGGQAGATGIAIWRKTFQGSTVVMSERITDIRRNQPRRPLQDFGIPRNYQRKAR